MIWAGERPSIPKRCLDGRIGAPVSDVIKAGLIAVASGCGKRKLRLINHLILVAPAGPLTAAAQPIRVAVAPLTALVLGNAAAAVDAARLPGACGIGFGRQGAKFE